MKFSGRFKSRLEANDGIVGCVSGICTYDALGPYHCKFRRAQLSIRYGDRSYDRSIAGLGAGKMQRYFASDFDRLSSRLFDANGSLRRVVGGV
jgi:hypothetical protein